MKFLSIYKTVERNAPPSQEEMCRMGDLIEQGMKAGYLLAVEGCLPTRMGARVRLSNGSITVTDRAGLEKTACECYGRIRHIYQRLLPGTYPPSPSRSGIVGAG